MASICISVLGPPISEQAKVLGIEPRGMNMPDVDKMSSDLTRAWVWGLLTDAEVDRARRRLLKRAKFAPKESSNG